MSRPVRVVLLGKPFTVQTDDSEERVQRVARMVDERLESIRQRASLPGESLALLAALTLADDLDKERERLEALRTEVRQRALRLRQRLRPGSDR